MRRFAAVVVLAGVAGLLHGSALFGGQAYFGRDIESFLYERLIALRACVQEGSLPLWNPYPAFGEPMLGIANAQFAYPITWLALAFSPEATQALIVTVHTFLAGLGVYLLGRELQLSRFGALLAGTLWSLCGPVQSAVDQANVLVGASMIAWAWLGFARLGRTGRPADACIAGLALAGCLLGGSPESAVMASAGVVLALAPLRDVAALAVRLRRLLGPVALALALGIGLSAVQWLPTAVLAGGSGRSNAVMAVARMFWSNHPAVLAQIVLPVPLDSLPLSWAVRRELFEGREPLLASLYMGLATAGLAAAGLLGGACRHRRLLALVSLFAFCISLGRFSPLWDVASRLPVLSLIRYPSRAAILGCLPLVLLAGAGIDALRTPDRRRGFAVAGLALGAVMALALALARPEAALWSDILMGPEDLGRPWAASRTVLETFRALHLSVVFALPTCLGLLARGLGAPGPAARGLATAAGILAVADVAVAGRDLNPTLPRSLLKRVPAPLADVDRERPNRTFVLEYTSRFALRALGREHAVARFYETTPEQGLEAAHTYPFVSLGQFGARIESVPVDVPLLRRAQVGEWVRAMHALAPTVAFARMLELSGVEYVLTLHDPGAGGRLELLRKSRGRYEDVLTYRVRDTLPRAFAAAGARIVGDGAVIRTLIDPGFDPRGEIALPGGAPSPPGVAGEVRIARLGFDRVRLEAETTAPGYVVLLEAWDPGWRATVDGRPAPLLRANLIFRAVPVPAGRHTVEMLYRPVEALVGAALSVLSLSALAWAGLRKTGRMLRRLGVQDGSVVRK